MAKVRLYKAKRRTRSNPERKVWVLRWFAPDGTRALETIGEAARMTLREARAIQRERQGKMDNGLVTVDRPGRVGLTTFLQLDREAVKLTARPKTIQELRIAAKHATRVLGDDFDIRKMDHIAIGRIAAGLVGRSPATVGKTLGKLSAAFGRGVALRTVVANPFIGFKKPRVQDKPVRTYTAVEVAAMVSAAPNAWWRALLRMAFTTGLRQGELLNLVWSDIDGAAGTVTVNAKRAGTIIVDGEPLPLLAWEAKTKETRTVRVPPATLAALAEIHDPEAASPYVFLSVDRLRAIEAKMAANGGELPASYHIVPNIRRDIRRIQGAALPGAELRSFHDLRRSYGTVLAQTCPLHELRVLMGHSTIGTTARYYLAPSPDLAARVDTAFEDLS